MAREDEVDLGALQALERVAGVVDDVPLAPGARHRQQVVVEDEHAKHCRDCELLLDPAVPAAADLAIVEVGLARVDRDDRRLPHAKHRVAVAEQLLEVDVADVARVVVAGDHDHRLALDAVQVLAREHVLLLEPVRGEVARDHDDVRFHLVHLGDRALEVLWKEELLPAMQVRKLDDFEHRRKANSSRSCASLAGSSETLRAAFRPVTRRSSAPGSTGRPQQDPRRGS